MNLFQAITVNFKKYVTFTGRAGRPEFWYWILFIMLASTVASILDEALFPAQTSELVYPLSSIFNLITFLPGLAVGARRLHDIGRSGWWQLLGLTIIGLIPLILWWAKKSTLPQSLNDTTL